MRKGCNFALVYERGAISVKISILKGKGLSLRAEPPRIKINQVPPPGGDGVGWFKISLADSLDIKIFSA